MNRWFRPNALVVLSAALLAATGFVLWPLWGRTGAAPATPRPVPAGDQEIVYLGAASSNASTWERFVAAVRRLETDRPELHLKVVSDADAFPSQTAAVPELAVTVGNHPGRLWFRWYKLTGDTGTGVWVDALARRDPPPLAIIGGGSSDRARDLARELDKVRPRLPAPPLFLITTATADQVTLEDGQARNLTDLYAGRTLRFCFTNRQMAEAVTDFIWRHDDLRPDTEPVYMVQWEDDPYSVDLFDRFREVLLGDDGSGGILGRVHAARTAAQTWALTASGCALGGFAPTLDWTSLWAYELYRGPSSARIHYSIGDFNQPNPEEAKAAELLINRYSQYPAQQRPLLVLPATPQPARRLLRALMRLAPMEASQFVIASGDGIDFNTVYRDRNLTWPIQDLPVALVLFCHRNPVDPSAFRPDQPGRGATVPDPGGRTATGTQDLLLYRDIVESVARAAYTPAGLLASADELRDRLRKELLPDGRSRFDAEGNQQGGGEYVVYLRPDREADRVRPRAFLRVWNRSPGPHGPAWVPVPVDGADELEVQYGLPTTGSDGGPPP
jgi:hypothetical protein